MEKFFLLIFLLFIIFSGGFCLMEKEAGHLINIVTDITKKNAASDDSDLSESSAGFCEFVGTNFFGVDGCRQKCFSAEDIALLAARRDFEAIIPKNLPKCLLDDKTIMTLMQYFYGANQVIQRMASGGSKRIAEKAFYDALGGYLKHYLIPVSKYSFYAGMVCLKTIENVLRLYRQCKSFLNTNGNGWLYPIHNIQSEFNFHVNPLRIFVSVDETDETPACINLEMSAGDIDDDHMIVSLPKLEPEESDGYLSNIWLPFRRKRTFNLRSTESAFIVLKYFETVSRCYNFQSICQDTFNRKLREWIVENIEIHLADDVLYPGLGAILRIYETVRKTRSPVVAVEVQNALKTSSPETKNRRKSHEYRLLEHKAKELETTNWFPRIFRGRKAHVSNVDDFENILQDSETSSEEYGDPERRMKYIYVTVAISMLLLIIVLVAAVMTERKNRKKVDLSRPPPRRKKRRCNICKSSCQRHNAFEEDENIKSKSSSILSPTSSDTKTKSSRPSSTVSSTSSKCLPSCLRATRSEKDEEKAVPVVETTSMDSSLDSDHHKKPVLPPKDKKQTSNAQRKSVTIDEKPIAKRGKKTSNGRSKKPDIKLKPAIKSETRPRTSSTGRGDKSSSDQKTKSSSWETVYEP